MLKRSLLFISVICLITFLLLGGMVVAEDGSRHGGTFRYAAMDDPPPLDQHLVTSHAGTVIAQHIFETLYTYDSEYSPVPMLAEDSNILDDGRIIEIHLRSGVTFHNGKELIAEDVKASLDRAGELGTRIPMLYEYLEEIEILDDYTIRLNLKEPFGPWKTLLAFQQEAVIYPKEIIEEAGGEPLSPDQYIGTGPYKFVEWKPDDYLLLERFDNYSAREDEPDGYGGKRVAYFDEIEFIPVPEVGTRETGVRTGEYNFAREMPGDLYESHLEDPDVAVTVGEMGRNSHPHFNTKKGIMSDKNLRQAILAAVDMEPALMAAHGPEDLWEACGSIYPEGTVWYSDAGLEKYSQADPAKSEELAEEAGYDGEEIRFMTTTSYEEMYDTSVVIAHQLAEAGFNIDLQIYDWATLVERRADPDLWDMFYTTHGFVPDPLLYTVVPVDYPTWWDTPEKEELVSNFIKEVDTEKRAEIWSEIQGLIYQDVPIMQVGRYFDYNIMTTDVEGIGDTVLIWPSLWNVWFE